MSRYQISTKYHGLLISDDQSVRHVISQYLGSAGYSVRTLSSGLFTLQEAGNEVPHIVIIDLAAPGKSNDCVDLIRWVRGRSEVPIIILSACGEETLRVQCLDTGADDYLTMPFGRDEFVARVRALVRRASYADSPSNAARVIEVGKLTINLQEQSVAIDGIDICLSWKEFTLLAELACNADKPLTHDALIDRVWGSEFRGSNHYLYVYIGQIRKRLGAEYASLLKTVPGHGYVLRTPQIS